MRASCQSGRPCRSGARRALDDLLWREHQRGRPRAVGREQYLAVQPRRHGDSDGAAARDRPAGQQQARSLEAEAMAAGRHRPFIGIGLAIARIVGLDFAQQEAALLERQQSRAGFPGQNVARQQAGDVEARLARRHRQFLRLDQALVAVALEVGGAVACPVATPVDAGIEGGAGRLVGDPGLAQGPGMDMPGRRILGPRLAPQSIAAGVAGRQDLIAVVLQRQLRLEQDPSLAQQDGDGVRGIREAQQHRAVHGIDGAAAHDRRVPFAAVDGRSLAVGDLDHLLATCLH
jgi:hypothetical protein